MEGRCGRGDPFGLLELQKDHKTFRSCNKPFNARTPIHNN